MIDPAGSAWPAPAKLNLFLHVTGRRADGYHTLQTLFQLIDWGDEVRIEATAGSTIRRTGSNYAVPEHEDLVVRAAQLLQSETGCGLGADIAVTKHIPMGSGMGGGSSDAATVLVVLNRLWGCGLETKELAELGCSLGADIPVFIHGHTAMAEGIGDRLTPVSLGERHYVLVFPGVSIPTQEIFNDPGLRRNSEQVGLAAALAGEARNDCEGVVRERYPEMAHILDSLEQWGQPSMTGTGSAIFLRAEGREQAIHTARALKNLYNVRAVSGVDRSPLHRKLNNDGR